MTTRLILFLVLSNYAFAQTIKYEGISEVKPLKRGKEYNVKWSGGPKDQAIRIELTTPLGKVQSWEELQNDGEHVVKISSKLKPGKDYTFKILTTNGDGVSSQNVEIKRKIPLALKIAVIIVVPAIGILVLTSPNDKNVISDPIPPN